MSFDSLKKCMAKLPTLTPSQLFHLLVIDMALHFSLIYYADPGKVIKLHDYVDGSATTPFIFRILPYLLYCGFEQVLGLFHAHMPVLPHPFLDDESWFTILLNALGVIVAVEVTAVIIKQVTHSDRMRWLSLAIFPCIYFNSLLAINRNLFYTYDMSSLAFFTILLWAGLNKRYLIFLLTLVPAMVNKETAIMAIPLTLFLNWKKEDAKKLLAFCFLAGALALAVKYTVVSLVPHYFHVEREIFSNKLYENARQIVNPLAWISMPSIFGYMWIPLILVWRNIAPRLRYSFAMIAFLWLIVMIPVGVIRELRIFSELSSFLIVALASGLANRFPRLKQASGVECTH